jgi:hypothetical protein
MDKMDDQAFISWSGTAGELAMSWHQSMLVKSRCGARFDEEDIRDFLVDLFLERGAADEIFHEKNRGRLYNYSLMFLQHNKDSLCHADSIHADEDEGIDEDRLQCLATQASAVDALELAEQREKVSVYLDRLSALKSNQFSNVLAEIFQVTTRAGRNYSSSSRQEKVHDVIMQAAKEAGMSAAAVKKMAAEIVSRDRRREARGYEVDIAALESLEAMFSLKPKTTSEKTLPLPERQKPQADLFEMPLAA